jgi:hypothetical protein
VPQVAFDTKIHFHDPAQPRIAHPAQQSDRAPSPFESLLDDSAQIADQPPPPPAENKAAPAEAAQPTTQNNEPKSAAASDPALTTKPDHVDQTDENGKAVANEPSNVKAKTAAAAADVVKDTDDDKPVIQSKSDNSTIAAAIGDGQPVTADAITPTAAAIQLPDQVPTSSPNNGGQLPGSPVIIGDGAARAKLFDPNTAKVGAGKQVDAGKQDDAQTQLDTDQIIDQTAGNSLAAPKLAPQAHADKPQLTATDSDKEHVAEMRAEFAVNGRLGSDTNASVSTDANVTAQHVSADTAAPLTLVTDPAPAAPGTATPAAPVAKTMPQPVAIPLAGRNGDCRQGARRQKSLCRA